jgi:hypothetical protein
VEKYWRKKLSRKLTDRNPHTGEKLQTKQTSDAYRSNYDAIFRKSGLLLTPIEDFAELIELNKDIEMDTICFGPDDGIGFFATKEGYSEQHPFGYTTRPEWATHFVWYNK